MDKEQNKKLAREWYQKNKEKILEKRKSDPERERERKRRDREKHLEKRQEHAREYRRLNAEKINEARRVKYQSDKELIKDRNLKRVYNLSLEEYNQMIVSQDSKCKICDDEVKLVIDHCHTTGNIRGLLCSRCNLTLGSIKDNILVLKKMIEYLN
jgi:hypothetical protein